MNKLLQRLELPDTALLLSWKEFIAQAKIQADLVEQVEGAPYVQGAPVLFQRRRNLFALWRAPKQTDYCLWDGGLSRRGADS